MPSFTPGVLIGLALSLLVGSSLPAARTSLAPQNATKMPVASQAPVTAQAGTPSGDQTLIDNYCIRCHNDRQKTAGLSLAASNLDRIGENAEVWEKVAGRLRARTMPPANAPQPAAARADEFASRLETELDRLASLAPRPGHVPTHRLTRSEYANAIRDLLAMDFDVAALLPLDESGHGFDNIASILSFSPGLLERYMLAAQKISRLAVGDLRITPTSEAYKVSIYAPQDDHMGDELPFGSRGGAAIRHYFPLDAEYTIKVDLRRAITHSEIYGLANREQLDVLIDGVRVARFEVGGECVGSTEPRCIRPAGGNRPTSDYERTADAGLLVTVPVKAGRRSVAVTFLKRPGTGAAAEGGGLTRMPLAFDVFDNHLDEMTVEALHINGPLRPTGPGDTPSRQRVFACRPASDKDDLACARTILTRLARHAYRRPSTDQDVSTLMTFFRAGRAGANFDAGIQSALEALLVQPEFLFRIERAPAGMTPGSVYRLSDLELASRLSFFLWSSLPDNELLTAASQGTLRERRVLDAQVRRMLRDTRASALVSNFASQWLWLRNMRGVAPDPAAFPDFDDTLREAFQRETELFLESQLHDDRSVAELLTANYTFLNERLAKFYRVPNVYGSHFRRVTTTDPNRAGLLGHASILTVTSYSTRTSPVIRGRWLLENILGAPPPPPPPNVPALKENGEGHELPTSVRARLEEHRKNPACASCHARIDPLGFALEHFDGIGKWRDRDASEPINASGVLPDGSSFEGAVEFRAVLSRQRRAFAGTVGEKLLTYALGRGIEYYDRPALRQIVREAEAGDYRWSALILKIVESTPFQMQQVVP